MIPLSLPSSSSSTESTEIDSFLRRHYGLNKLKIDWLNRCISELNISTPGFGNLSVADRGDHIYQKFLDSDIKSSSDGVLPDNISTLCENDLPGPFILQVDNIVTRRPHPQRSVMLTDGVRHVVGWEIRPIQAIEDLSPRMKVLISNVTVECGILMLVPEGVDVLRKAKHNTSAVKEEEEANQPRSVKSGDKSHGSTEDEEISLKDFDSLFSDWCNRNKAPTRYKIEISICGVPVYRDCNSKTSV
ncbi:hypothetical protein MKX03_010897 [Papaver bracteatum]|nr:hypothetical protein MKX03_010897 [Papaver bracteatum]